MATIRVPSNVSSVTFTTSGVKTPVNNLISGLTAAEGTAFAVNSVSTHNGGFGAANLQKAALNGDLSIAVPNLITSITINAIVYAVGGAQLPFGKLLTNPVPAVAGSQFLLENFSLVQG